jgi:MFS family permease
VLRQSLNAAVAALAVMLSRNEVVIILAATIAGFGRGANGAAGPFSPVEQAWIALEVEDATRRHAISLNATLGYLGMAAGASFALASGSFDHGRTTLDAYQWLFAIPLAGSLAAIIFIAFTREIRVPPAAPIRLAAPTADPIVRQENRQLRRLALANCINGLAIGIIGPLMALWFARRFGQGLTTIGPALAASFLLAAAGSVLSGRISNRFGAVGAVLWMRACGIVLLLATPFSPIFGLAATLYALRAACNRGTVGARQAVTADLTRAERRGMAASVQNLSLQIPRTAGPLLGGWLIHRGDFVLPFLIAAGLQVVYLLLYGYLS